MLASGYPSGSLSAAASHFFGRFKSLPLFDSTRECFCLYKNLRGARKEKGNITFHIHILEKMDTALTSFLSETSASLSSFLSNFACNPFQAILTLIDNIIDITFFDTLLGHTILAILSLIFIYCIIKRILYRIAEHKVRQEELELKIADLEIRRQNYELARQEQAIRRQELDLVKARFHNS